MISRFRQATSGFYDLELGVVFLDSAGGERNDGTIWGYRYRRPGQ